MSFLHLTITVAIFCSATALPINERIYGGTYASLGQFPYIVSLRTRGSHFCAASIVTNYWLVSAAHCVVGTSAQAMTVVTGTTSLSSGGTGYGVYGAISHPQYDPDLMQYDISVIRTAQPIQFSTTVSAISLNRAELQGGTPVTLAGWGVTEYGDLSQSLLWINLPVLDVQRCQQMSPRPVFESNICTFKGYGEGACNGDSGGPLTVNGVLTGVVSWGIPCAKGYPDVFTKVSSYISWIQANVS